jgi:branched-chain amino acid transport system substrate-binding protein
MRKRLAVTIGVVLILGLVAFVVGACGSSTTTTSGATTTSIPASTTTGSQATTTTGASSSTTAATGAEVKVGAAIPLSGFAANQGKEAVEGLQLAVDQWNASGGINGGQIKLIVEDSAGEAKTAVSATQKLLSVDKVVGMVGTMYTFEAMPEAPLVTKAQVPLVLGQANSSAIPPQSAYILMPHPTDKGTVTVLLSYATDVKKVKKLAFIGPDSDFSRGSMKIIQDVFPTMGGEVVLAKLYPQGTTDFKTLLTQVKAAGAELVYTNGSAQDISNQIRQASELGLTPLWTGSTQIADKSILQTVGNLAEGAFYADPSPTTDAGKKARADMVAAYAQKYGHPIVTDTPYYAYDTVGLMASAIQAVGTDGTKIKDWLTNLNDFTGVSGEISFGGTNVAEEPMFIFEAQNGNFVQTDYYKVVR